MSIYTGCAPEEVCPRGAVSENGHCLTEQTDITFPALEADTRVTLSDVGVRGSDTTSNMDGSNAETDTTSASDADIIAEFGSDSSDTSTSDDGTSIGADAEELPSDGSELPVDAGGLEDGT